MGCFNSKSTVDKDSKQKASKSKTGDKKGTAANKGSEKPTTPKNNKSNEPAADGVTKVEDKSQKPAQNPPEDFLNSVLDGTEHFFNSLSDSDTMKQVIALTFVNSCVEVVRTKFRLKIEAVQELLDKLTKKLPLLRGCLPKVEERSMDDGFSRILLAWASNNPTYTKKIPAAAGQAALDALYIRYILNASVSFEEILKLHFRWVSVNQAALESFSKFSEGKDVMTPEQLGKFLRESQKADDITDRHVTEKYKYRFGGGVHRYNFAGYTGSVLANNVIDPSRTADVWQDMTQSFTHYIVGCVRITSELDMNYALKESFCRTFVVDLKKDKNGQICTGSLPFQKMLDTIKQSGFVTNTYPIIILLSPNTTIPVDVQDTVAGMLSDTLGPILAKGLMFEGAAITDPKFSPGALRKRVLLASFQGSLKPFVGFMVADMNKDGLGVRVTDVVESTPAAKGGVLKDDWLTHFNDEAIRNKAHLRECLAKLKVGDEIKIKRENLNELTIVVGGTVNPDDKTVSSTLSNLVFFRLTKSETDSKPWDTLCVDAAKLPATKLDRTVLANRFGFVSINGAADLQREQIAKASLVGMQFIDTDQSETSLMWTLGRFSDNGHCGYLLKTNLDAKAPELTIEVICGPRAVGCVPMTNGAVKIFGAGTGRVNGNRLSLSGYNEATVAIVELTFEVEGDERVFIASFSPILIRPGYRALPCLAQGEVKVVPALIHGVYLLVNSK